MTLVDLVADSEDEEYLFRSKDLLQPQANTNPPHFNLHTTATAMADSAVASTLRGEVRAEPEVVAKKSRPKPKKKPPTGSIDAAPVAPPSNFVPTTTTAPRIAVTAALPGPIPPTESRLQDMPLTIADRAKSRVRNAKSKLAVQDTTDTLPDEDERLLQLSPYRPRQNDVRGAKGRPIPIPPPPSIHPSQESLVAPTSDYQPVPAFSSQLPPSDPPSSTLPLPTSTPESAKKRRRVTDADIANESPLNPSKKRKRQRVVMDDEDDNEAHVPPPRTVATVDQPPPNFFASSSSSLPPPPAPLVRGKSGRNKPTKRKQPADDPPPAEVADPEPPKEKKSRPKPKKKSGVHPDPSGVGQSSSVSAPASRSRTDAKDPGYKSAEIVNDSDEEAGSLFLLPPPRLVDSQSPLSDLSEPTSPGPSKPITPSSGRKRLVPEVVITTVPKKRTSSPSIREAEERGNIDRDGANGGPKGKKRQKKAVQEEPPQDAKENQESTPPPLRPTKPKSNPTVTPSSVSRKTPVPSSASSFARLNYGHSLASEEKPMSMAEIIRRANSAAGTPSGIKSYSSFTKASRSALKKIAPLHARRKTPPPLPPKPPAPKKTKKQLELEEKWEEELEETIEGWAALSTQEREVLRKQKRDMEMGYED